MKDTGEFLLEVFCGPGSQGLRLSGESSPHPYETGESGKFMPRSRIRDNMTHTYVSVMSSILSSPGHVL